MRLTNILAIASLLVWATAWASTETSNPAQTASSQERSPPASQLVLLTKTTLDALL